MSVEFCRDCENFEDRRDIENVTLCSMHHGPSVTCPQFSPKDIKTNMMSSEERFCLNCSNYENIAGISVCSKDHRPGLACRAFRRKNSKIIITMQTT